MFHTALRRSLTSSTTITRRAFSRKSIVLSRNNVSRRLLAPIATHRNAFSTAVQQTEEVSSSAKAPFVSTPERNYEYFTNVEITDSGVAIIRFDNPTKKVRYIRRIKRIVLTILLKTITYHHFVIHFHSGKHPLLLSNAGSPISLVHNRQQPLH